MKLLLTTLFIFGFSLSCFAANDEALDRFKAFSKNIDVSSVQSLGVHDGGRLKPFDTLAREAILYINGKFSFEGISAPQTYLGLVTGPQGEQIEILNIRDPEVREKLGLPKGQRRFSVQQLEQTQIAGLAQPLVQREQRNSRSLEPSEKNVVEAYHQLWVLKKVISGGHFLEATDFSTLKPDNITAPRVEHIDTPKLAKSYLSALAQNDHSKAKTALENLKEGVAKSPMPKSFREQLGRTETEVLYTKSKLFFIAALLLAILSLLLLYGKSREWVLKRRLQNFVFLPIALIIVALGIRIYLTGFAPVTNMYGTMIWVGLGIVCFSLILLYLYKNYAVVAWLWLASSFILLLTESMPLVLNPGLDPIVAVLRSNLWLTFHVLTITISYAAFSIAMVLGNVVLVRSIFTGIYDDQMVKEYAHSAYRMIQLGVFLLSVGIVLGGIWADYSWGRFWGWDPKETWALIADVGFLAILHARLVGWLKPFGVLAASPAAYLLVIMAWYGVNFILATGLHSYGFSSGGAQAVTVFVVLQIIVIGISLGRRQFVKKKNTAN